MTIHDLPSSEIRKYLRKLASADAVSKLGCLKEVQVRNHFSNDSFLSSNTKTTLTLLEKMACRVKAKS
jgi:hypothetical protein